MPDSVDDASHEIAIPRLQVSIGEELFAPSTSQQLLLAFHFGAGEAPTEHPAIVSPGLAPVAGGDQYERWWYEGEVSHRDDGRIRLSECDDYTVATCKVNDSDEDIGETAREAYLELLAALRHCRHSRPVKIWNYLSRINDGDADAERYRRFSVGRAEAFAHFRIDDELSPTGTAIGARDEAGLTIIAIATDRDFSLMENPRQVSAFRYPRQFGPSSPKFGRGGLVSTNDHRLYLLSGTASVVGYESLHPFDTHNQLDEILRNLDVLCDSLSGRGNGSERLDLGNASVLRVYIRQKEDAAAIEATLRSALELGDARLLMLQGDICRRELMVEIDGIKVS